MKTHCLSLIFVVLSITANAQSFNWARSGGGSQTDYLHKIACDTYGNVYIIGGFYNSISFDTTITTTPWGLDMYIAKFTSLGELLWVRRFGGPGWDMAIDIVCDEYETFYVTGFFESQAIFGNDTIFGNGGIDVFTAKFNSDGNTLWVRAAGGYENDYGYGIGFDHNDNVFVTGIFESGSISFVDTALSNSTCGSDIFLAKYDSSGTIIWANQAGGSNWDDSKDLAIDASGNIYITGQYGLSATFDTVTLAGIGNEAYIAKYDNNGNILWASGTFGQGSVDSRCISLDINGNPYITGTLIDSAMFGNVNVTCLGSEDFFIAKSDLHGNFIWVKEAGGNFYNTGYDVHVENSNSILVTGLIVGTTTFDNTILTSLGHSDIFLAKYDGTGNLIHAQNFGSNSATPSDQGTSITSDIFGNVYIAGQFTGSFTLAGSLLSSYGERDVFISQVTGLPIGIDKNSADNSQFQLYPNPANSSLYIKHGFDNTKDLRINIYNISGQIVLSEDYNGFSQVINVNISGLDRGIYCIELLSQNKKLASRFVK